MAGAVMIFIRPWINLLLVLTLFFIFGIYSCNGQSQNIEAFYPFAFPSPTPAPSPAPTPHIVPVFPPSFPPVESPPPLPPLPLPLPQKKSSGNKDVAIAAAATAASTLVVCAVVFFFVQRCIVAKRRRKISGGVISTNGGVNNNTGSQRVHSQPAVVNRNEFERYDGNLKGFIVDEDGLDVLYWRKLEAKNAKKSFRKEMLGKRENGEEIGHDENEQGSSRENELPLFRGRSSTSNMDLMPKASDQIRIGSTGRMVMEALENQEPEVELTLQSSSSRTPPPPHSPPPTPPPLPVVNNKGPKAPLPPPPPPPPKTNGPGLPPPPPPPKAKSRSLNALAKPEPKGVKLKPLHWDKVNTNREHSMVWDKIDGSFRFDGDLMEALFGTVAANRKSTERGVNAGSSSQVCILDEKKSQNFAIVIKSLTISQREILDVLYEGRGISAENLEKLARIAPSEEEISKIIEYNEDPSGLADAERFLYHILQAVPSAFTRFNAMHFRYNYGLEIVQLKESLETIELGCKELRTRGLFMKLLEAILKAGNRMNAGTSRGNAQAFKLSSLRKLSDVRSSDGKTTLLHFVVEEVVRSEGKRGVLNRNHSLSRSGSQHNNGNFSSEQNTKSKEEREKEYMMLGLPVVGGISSEFSNVKKAASIDYDIFSSTCTSLTKRMAETRELVLQCEKDGGENFLREMKGFLEAAEKDLKVMNQEQNRVMEFVKTTTEYYQGGASKEKGAQAFQLFVVVKDFLGMVDQTCVEISRNVQRRKVVTASLGSSSSSPDSPPSRNPVRFPILPKNFMSESSSSNSSESDNDI